MAGAVGPRILIIEDDPLLSGLISQELQNKQFDIQTSLSGEDGLETAKKFMPDIILLDIMLPGIDGFEVLTRLKNDPALKNSVVIILSNLGQEGDIQKGTQLGAEKYIVKVTLSLSEVVQMVKDVWAKHHGSAAGPARP